MTPEGRLLKRISLGEWGGLVAGDVDLDALKEMHLDDGGDDTDHEAALEAALAEHGLTGGEDA